jgi:hypothetical protein
MPQTVQTLPGHVGATGIATQHRRLSAAAAATLHSLTSGGIPTRTDPNGNTLYPRCVTLQVEAGAAQTVYYTLDGSTPSAINGLVVPVAPAQLLLPYPDLLSNHKNGAVSATNQQIQLFAGGATSIQSFYEFW